MQSSRDEEHRAQLERLRGESMIAQSEVLQQLQILTLSSNQLSTRRLDTAVVPLSTESHRDMGYVQEIEPVQSDERTGRMTKRRKGLNHTSRFRLSFAAWLTGRIWDVAVLRSQSGWTLDIRTWNLVPSDSPILYSCYRGNIDEVRKLLSAGQASLFDTDCDGRTLLWVRSVDSRRKISR